MDFKSTSFQYCPESDEDGGFVVDDEGRIFHGFYWGVVSIVPRWRGEWGLKSSNQQPAGFLFFALVGAFKKQRGYFSHQLCRGRISGGEVSEKGILRQEQAHAGQQQDRQLGIHGLQAIAIGNHRLLNVLCLHHDQIKLGLGSVTFDGLKTVCRDNLVSFSLEQEDTSGAAQVITVNEQNTFQAAHALKF